MTEPLPTIRRIRPGAVFIDGLKATEYNELVRAWEKDHAEVERLRGLLRELEWAGTRGYVEDEEDACPACWATREEGHRKPASGLIGPDGKPYDYAGCRLAAELKGAERDG